MVVKLTVAKFQQFWLISFNKLFPLQYFWRYLAIPVYAFMEKDMVQGYKKEAGIISQAGVDFILFDTWVDGWWLQQDNMLDISVKLSLQHVPIVGAGTLEDAVQLAQKGFVSHWGDFLAEGIVLRPLVDLFTREGHRIITKIKYRDFRH